MKNLINQSINLFNKWAEQDTAPDYLIIGIKTVGTAIVGFGLARIGFELFTNPSAFDSVGGIIASSFIVLRQKISTRGGGIEIDLEPYGYEGEGMTAYQNYLGGGMLGRIQNDCTIDDWNDDSELQSIAEDLSRHFHELTRHDWNEWEDESFEQNQNKLTSVY